MATPTFNPARMEMGGFLRRLAALLIDWALCELIAAAYADPRVVPWPPVALLIVINTFFIGLFGQTPGLWLARLRCISYVDGGAIGIGKAFLRAVLLALFIPPLIMDPQQRGLHDRVAGSYVVRLPRSTT